MSRPRCPRCERAVRGCICQWIRHCDNNLPVLILQHPQERPRVKNTGLLLHLSLARSELVLGEQWPEQMLAEILGELEGNLLLYPETDAMKSDVVESNVVESNVGETRATESPLSEPIGAPEPKRLIVLDATWRKSRKMLYLNPLLERLPRLALSNTPESRYRIRRAQRAEQLSTLEASCYALARLEQGRVDYDPLLCAFDGFNDEQLGFRPNTGPGFSSG